MFFLILTGITTLLHLYCAWRIGSLPVIRHHLPGWRGRALVWGLWLLYVIGMAVGDETPGVLPELLSGFAFQWLGALFLLTLPLLAVDLVTLFGYRFRSQLSRLRGTAIGVGLLLIVVALIQGLRPPVVIEHEVNLAKLPAALDGTVVAALSDLHLGLQRDAAWMAERVAQTNALEPDLVLLLGDLVEGDPASLGDLVPVLRQLRAPLGVWAITGNHEFHGDTDATIALLESAGVRWLRDEALSVRPGLVLAGVDDRRRGGEPALRSLLEQRPEGATLLLSHRPALIPEAAALGVDLMLSGHTHGGQIWPFGELVRLQTPFVAGRYTIEEMTLLVCRGTGAWGPRMRLWHPSELFRIHLRSGATQRFLGSGSSISTMRRS